MFVVAVLFAVRFDALALPLDEALPAFGGRRARFDVAGAHRGFARRRRGRGLGAERLLAGFSCAGRRRVGDREATVHASHVGVGDVVAVFWKQLAAAQEGDRGAVGRDGRRTRVKFNVRFAPRQAIELAVAPDVAVEDAVVVAGHEGGAGPEDDRVAVLARPAAAGGELGADRLSSGESTKTALVKYFAGEAVATGQT